jgi:DNA-binding CsgD family transcriptional regulator/tetratricopeptide (TPR) repeat protein
VAIDEAGLCGRAAELSWFADRVASAVAGHGTTVLVEGEAGIGKTALVRAVRKAAAKAGCQVLSGSGDELAQALPLVPLLDALHISETSDDPDRVAIMRLLHGDTAQSAADLVAAAGERIIGLIDDACANGPVVLTIDDLQWADRFTIAILTRLAAHAKRLPLLLVGTYRWVPRGEDLTLFGVRGGAIERIHLEPLAPSAVDELVTELAGGRPAPELSAMADGAAGNPFYLTELVATLARDGDLEISDGIVRATNVNAPKSLSSAIESRLGYLSEDARLVLRAATLLGVRLSVAALGTVLCRPVPELVPLLDEARDAGVLTEVDGSLTFRHPLVRAALYNGMPGTVRRAWHVEAGRLLTERGAKVDDVARQLIAAFDPPGQSNASHHPDDWVVRWLVDNSAMLVGKAPTAAARILDRVVDAIGADREPVLACRLAEALYRAGNLADAEDVCRKAMVAIDDPTRRVDLHWTLAQCRAMTGRVAESLAELEIALGAPRYVGRDRARLLVLAARAHWDLGNFEDADRMADEASTEAKAAGDALGAGWALHVRTIVATQRGGMRQALPLFDHALDVVSADPTTTDLRLLLQINRAVTLEELDQIALAIDTAREVRDLADRTGHVVRMGQACSALGQLHYHAGEWDEALVEVDLLSDELKHPMVSCCDHGVAALISLQRGDHAAACAHLDAVAEHAELLGDRVVPALALANSLRQEQIGSRVEALAVLSAGLDDGEDNRDLLPDLVRLAVSLGEIDLARRAVAQLETLAREADVPHCHAAVAYCQGLLDGDPAELLRAAEGYHDTGRPLLRAKAFEAAMGAFADRDETRSARAAGSRALDIYAELGAEWHFARAQAAMRTKGIRRGPHAPHRVVKSGWDSLTPAETGIAALVTEGLSNRQIGERLFLSPRTVSTHVSHIICKLGVRTRTDVAREASQRRVAAG